MKAFSFRLERALRWREAQLSLQKSRTAAALQRLTAIQSAIQARRTEAIDAAVDLSRAPTDVALTSYAGFLRANRNEMRKLNEQIGVARCALAAEMEQLVQVNRKAHLLDKLKAADEVQWRTEFDREIAAFTDEAFLASLQSKGRKQ